MKSKARIVVHVVPVPGYVEPSINVKIVQQSGEASLYSFSGWRHYFGHFGDVLPLLCVRVHVSGRQS